MTILSRGDVAVVGYDFNTNDSFSVVFLRAVDTANAISFTENSAATDNTLGNYGEGVINWTPPSNLAAGTVVTFSESSTEGLFNVYINGAASGTVTANTLTSGFITQFWSNSSSGDQIFVYQGNPGESAAPAVPTHLFGLHLGSVPGDVSANATDPEGNWDPVTPGTGGTSSYRPDVLNPNTNGGTSYSVGFYDPDLAATVDSAGTYTGPMTATNAQTWMQRITDPLNWTFSSSITGTAGGNSFGSTAFSISAPNANPSASGLAASISVSEDVAGNADFSALSVSDTDNPTGLSLVMTATEGTFSAVDVGGVTETLSNGNKTLTLTGTTAAINSYLDTASNIKYTSAFNDNGSPGDSIAVKVNDNQGSGDISVGTAFVNITAVNDAPTIANLNGDSRTWSEAVGVNVGLDFNLDATIADIDSTGFNGGNITVTFDRSATDDNLMVATTGNVATGGGFVTVNGDIVGTVSGGLNGSDLIVTFTTATATVANAQQVLRAIQYFNSGGDTPTAGTFNIDVTINDGDGGPAPASSKSTVSMTVTAADDPTVAVDDAFGVDDTATLGVGLNLINDNGSGVDTDPDSAIILTEVNGAAGDIGKQVALASGALLTVNADGTFGYDTNGAFDGLAAPGSGGTNLTATETFTYTVTGSDKAAVTITVTGTDGNDTVEGTKGVDLLKGFGFDDALHGYAGADTLQGGDGNDDLFGGQGVDTMEGGGGDDRYRAGSSLDIVTELADKGTDWVIATASYVLPDHVENIRLLLGGNLDGTGNGLDNRLIGNAGANALSGGAGRDSLNGGDGADILTGGSGRDYLTGGADADTFRYGALADSGTLQDRDAIFGFASGVDKIDVTGLGFSELVTGGFTGKAGQLNVAAGTDTIVTGDADGDLKADFHLKLTGAVALAETDFLF